jgi:hypothetical protein
MPAEPADKNFRYRGAGAPLGASTLIPFATASGKVALDGEGAKQSVLGGAVAPYRQAGA